jgi:large subunit ribosomal protein L10
MPNVEKTNAVAEYKRLFEDSGSFFVTDYQGLNVADMTDLRRKLRENNIRLLIGKNTLFRIAADQASISGIRDHLLGPTAVAFTTEDPAMAARILHDSFKERELPRMKAFWLDKVAYDAADIRRLADLPPKDQLYSQVVAAVESPMTSLVGALDGFFRKLVGTIDALAQKRESEL